MGNMVSKILYLQPFLLLGSNLCRKWMKNEIEKSLDIVCDKMLNLFNIWIYNLFFVHT